MQRLLDDFVHSAFDGSIHILLLDVSSDGNDLWLEFFLDVHLVIKLADSLGGFITIHEGHVAVHQNE